MALVSVPSTLTYLPRSLGGLGQDGADISFPFASDIPVSSGDIFGGASFTPPTPMPFTPGVDALLGAPLGGSFSSSDTTYLRQPGAGSQIAADILHAGTAIAGNVAQNLTIPSGYSQTQTCDKKGNCITSYSKQAAGYPIGTTAGSLTGNLGIGLGGISPVVLIAIAGIAFVMMSKK